MYPSIVSKQSGQSTLQELMKNDLEDFQQHNPGMTFEDSADMQLKHGKTAAIRYFHDVNHDSHEVAAYIDEQKVIALLSLELQIRKRSQ